MWQIPKKLGWTSDWLAHWRHQHYQICGLTASLLRLADLACPTSVDNLHMMFDFVVNSVRPSYPIRELQLITCWNMESGSCLDSCYLSCYFLNTGWYFLGTWTFGLVISFRNDTDWRSFIWIGWIPGKFQTPSPYFLRNSYFLSSS